MSVWYTVDEESKYGVGKGCNCICCKVFVNPADLLLECYRGQDTDDKEVNQLFECIKLTYDMNYPIVIMRDFVVVYNPSRDTYRFLGAV